MRVIADIHGMGDPEDEAAKDEFRLIKEGVLADVGSSSCMLIRAKHRLGFIESRWTEIIHDHVEEV